MPELRIKDQQIQVDSGSNLLDALRGAGLPINWSCRAGHCHSCLVQSLGPADLRSAQQGLSPQQQADGWLLACQCRVEQDLQLHLHDPASDGLPATLERLEQLPGNVIRLLLRPARAIRYQAGQHLVIWLTPQLARTFSLASLPGEPLLEFHLQDREHSAFCSALRGLPLGTTCHLGAPSGHLTYDPAWHDQPLLLLASGTGLAPLQAIARSALAAQHAATIQLWHWQADGAPCYLQPTLEQLAAQYPQLHLQLRPRSELDADLRRLRSPGRGAQALICGSPTFVELLRKPLFMAGLPGRQILDETFLSRNA
ncbi:MAG: 2Fe-2S iron-sulfur cluster-binding protein [Pseudomonadaceae bacterium]